MDDPEKSDSHVNVNAAYGLVGLNSLIWAWIFYQFRNTGMAGQVSLTLLAVPASAITFMIVVPIALLRMRRPRIAPAVASISLALFAITLLSVFTASGI